jgi:hypothetical protein
VLKTPMVFDIIIIVLSSNIKFSSAMDQAAD